MIRLDEVRFRYGRDGFELHIPALVIESAQRVAIVGPSGCGKTTLLSLLAGIAVPKVGQVHMNDVLISALTDAKRRAFRVTSVGMVFQEFELIEYLSLVENVLLPYRLHSSLTLTSAVRARAETLLARVGLADRKKNRIDQLSQGERQRVALCRALIAKPKFLLADEPTGNLDPSLKQEIVSLLFEAQREVDATLVMVTHDHSLLGRFDHVHPLDAIAHRGVTS